MEDGISVEKQLEYYKDKCKFQGWEIQDLKMRNEKLARKQGLLKKNYRGMQKNLQYERALRKLAEARLEVIAALQTNVPA